MNRKENEVRDLSLHGSEIENSLSAASSSPVSGGFTISRTVNGIPVSGNDFLKKYSVEDSDAMRILLTARRRANGTMIADISGENQIIH